MVKTIGLVQNCPVCSQRCDVDGPPVVTDGYDVDCPNCGRYAVSLAFYLFLRERADEVEKMMAAAIIFERRTMEPNNPDVHQSYIRMLLAPGDDRDEYLGHRFDTPPYPFRWDELLRHFPSTVSDRLDRCLLLLGKMSIRPGRPVEVDGYTGKMRRATFSEDPLAMDFALQTFEADGLVKTTRPKHVDLHAEITLQLKGWNRIADLERERGRQGGSRAFVAMRFKDENCDKATREALEAGIKAGGFIPVIINTLEHNGKICDRIVAEIRRSRFLVAEFTSHRQNVYYEAGFAQGLGLPVIWCCPEGEIKKAHFDTRQYAHITWKTPEELTRKLANRIQATIA